MSTEFVRISDDFVVNMRYVIMVRVADVLRDQDRPTCQVEVHVRDPSNPVGGTKYSWPFETKEQARRWIEEKFNDYL
jgi:hypothetical protein